MGERTRRWLIVFAFLALYVGAWYVSWQIFKFMVRMANG